MGSRHGSVARSRDVRGNSRGRFHAEGASCILTGLACIVTLGKCDGVFFTTPMKERFTPVTPWRMVSPRYRRAPPRRARWNGGPSEGAKLHTPDGGALARTTMLPRPSCSRSCAARRPTPSSGAWMFFSGLPCARGTRLLVSVESRPLQWLEDHHIGIFDGQITSWEWPLGTPERTPAEVRKRLSYSFGYFFLMLFFICS